MYKQIFIFLTLLIPFLCVSQIHSGEVIYKTGLTEQAKAEDLEIRKMNEEDKSFIDKYFEEGNRILPYLEYKLIFNRNEGLFENKAPSMAVDNGIDLAKGYQYAQVEGKYYTNLERGITLRQFFDYDQISRVEDKIEDLEWEIVEGEKIILGYKCKKAMGYIQNYAEKRRQAVAWFTTEIPFQFGPVDGAGLPGLILGFERGERFYYYADQINLSEENIQIEEPTKGKFYDRAQFVERQKELFNQLKNSSR